MSIPLTCRVCKARFSVKDEKAGRTVECPECGKAVRVPAADDAEDDKPAPRKTPARAEREERPSRSRDLDDAPQKKKSKLPLILGIVGGLLFLLCGACGGLGYYFYGKAKKFDERFNDKVTLANVNKLQVGMAAKDVEFVLGMGKKLTSEEFREMTTDGGNLTQNHINNEHRRYWTAWVDKGLVYRWRNDPDQYVLIAYTDSPENLGTLKALSYQVLDGPNATIHNEKFPLPRTPADADAIRLGIAKRPEGPPVINPPPIGSKPPITPNGVGQNRAMAVRVTTAELLADPEKYERKWLNVIGKVADISLSPGGDGSYLLTADGKPNELRCVRCIFGKSTFTQNIAAARGETVEISGRWFRGEPGEAVELLESELGTITDRAQFLNLSEVGREYAMNAAAADKKYKGKIFRLGGRVIETKPQGPGDGITISVSGSPKTKGVRASVPCTANWASRFEAKKLRDQVIVAGEVIGFSDGVVKMGDCWLLTR